MACELGEGEGTDWLSSWSQSSQGITRIPRLMGYEGPQRKGRKGIGLVLSMENELQGVTVG